MERADNCFRRAERSGPFWIIRRAPARVAGNPPCRVPVVQCYPFNSLIEMPPIATETLDYLAHTGRQYVGALRQKLGELLTKEAKVLAYRNAALQKKAADLIDHSRLLADQARLHPVQGLKIRLVVGLYRNIV